MAELLSLKPGDERRLNSHALSRFNDWNNNILKKVPQLHQLNTEQIKTDLDTYLNDNEIAEFNKCLADIIEWLSECMNSGDSYCPHAYDTRVITPMFRAESLIIIAYQKAEAERQEKEYKDRQYAAFLAINPPVDDAKKYLSDKEHDEFTLAVRKAIEVFLEKGVAYQSDVRALDYSWWLKKIRERKKEESQKFQAIQAASEYNHHINQEIIKLTSRLEHKQRDLLSYFRAQIRDKRYTGHDFDYVLSDKEKADFDATLVNKANKKILQIIPDNLRQFIILPSQYYRRYFPLPVASYSFEEVPYIDISFEIFATAYSEVCLKPGKKIFNGHEFVLPQIEEGGNLVTLQKPKYLGYYYLILKPEDSGGYVYWNSIPLILLNNLLNGEIKPEGIKIIEASAEAVTYVIPGVEDEITIPSSFADYLKTIGTIDQMANIHILTDKVASIVKSVLNELKVEQGVRPLEDKMKQKGTTKAILFNLFSQDKRPSDPEIKSLSIKPNTVYRYYQEWKKNHNHNKLKRS